MHDDKYNDKLAELIPVLRVRCPGCQKIISFELTDLPRINEFHTTNFQCPLCHFWVRLDFFVSPSWLNSFRFEEEKNEN